MAVAGELTRKEAVRPSKHCSLNAGEGSLRPEATVSVAYNTCSSLP